MKRLALLLLILLFTPSAWAIERNVASQHLELFAFDSATGAPKTGDAANLTAYVSIDGDASPDALGDTSATEISSTNAPGWYRFDLTQAETNGKNILYSGKSVTGGIYVVGRTVATDPPNLSIAVIGADGLPTVNVDEWDDTDVPPSDTAGYPKATIKDGTGPGEVDTASGVVKAGLDASGLASDAVAEINASIASLFTFSVAGVPSVNMTFLNSEPVDYGIQDTQLWEATVDDPQTARRFGIAPAPATLGIRGAKIVIFDVSATPDEPWQGRIQEYSPVTGDITLNRAPTFTVEEGDIVIITVGESY